MQVLFRLMIIAFCLLFTFILVGPTQSMYCDDYTDKFFNHDVGSTVWFAEAWAGASDDEEGFYCVWCHVGNGDNDYSGGSYQGGFHADAASADVAFEQPTPYFSSSFINGICQHCGRDAADPRINHSYGTFTCGDDTHVGHRCLESDDHKTYIYKCPSCDAYVGDYECQPHTHSH